MITFQEWLAEQIDMSVIGTEKVIDKISGMYDKAKYAIELVRFYDNSLPPQQKLLLDISTVAPLTKGVFGLFNSTENTNVIGPDVEQKLELRFGKPTWQKYKDQLQKLPLHLLKKKLKQYPEIDINKIRASSVIHVNTNRNKEVWRGKPNADALAILEIASTIVHEATHAMDVKNGIDPTENRAVQAERYFKDWVKKNAKLINNNPLLRPINIGTVYPV